MSATVQYRLTPTLHTQLNGRAGEWGVSMHEAARRLAVLAAYDLSTDDADRVARLAVNMGGSFASAAAALAEIGEEMF